LTGRFDVIPSIREIETDSNHLIAHDAAKQFNAQPAFTQVTEEAASSRAQTDVKGGLDCLPWVALTDHGGNPSECLPEMLG